MKNMRHPFTLLSRILISVLLCVAGLNAETADLKYGNVFLDGPKYDVVTLWSEVGDRSPYSAYFAMTPKGSEAIELNGLQKITWIIDWTREQLQKLHDREIEVQLVGQNIRFHFKSTVEIDQARKEGKTLDVALVEEKPSLLPFSMEGPDEPVRKKLDLELLKRVEMNSSHVYPVFRLSGLQGLGFVPTIRGLKSAYQGKFNFEFDASYVTENYGGTDGRYVYHVSGGLYRKHLRMNYWIEENTEFTARFSSGMHDADIALTELPTNALLRSKTLHYNLSDLLLGVRHVYTFKNSFLTPEMIILLPLSGRGDVLTSGNPDSSIGLEWLRAYPVLDLAAKINYTLFGDLDVFRPSVGEWDMQGVVSFSVAAARPIHDVYYTSVALNYSQNPLRDRTDIKALSGDIVTLGSALHYEFNKKTDGTIDMSAGLTDAAPDFSIGLSLTTIF